MERFLSPVVRVQVDGWKKDNGSYVEYCLVVHLDNDYCFHIDKRYNDFRAFFDSLRSCEEFDFDAPFPPKQMLLHSQSCLSERALFFQNFVDYCVSVKSVSEKLSKFLRVPIKVVDEEKREGKTQVHSAPIDDTTNEKALESTVIEAKVNVDCIATQDISVLPPATKNIRPKKARNKRGSVYFKNLMNEVDIDKILEKGDLTDDELLLLSRRNSNAVTPPSAVNEKFKLTSKELKQVFNTLTASNSIDMLGAMSCEQFMSWDEVQSVLASGALSTAEVEQRFLQFIDKSESAISVRNFQLLVNQLDLMGVKREERPTPPPPLNSQMPADTASLLRNTLSAHYLFDALSTDDISTLLTEMSLLTAERGTHIVRQNEIGDLFYVIEVGSAEASVSGLGVVKSYTNGESFGELALLHDSPRSATVTAVTDCTLWTLGLRTFRKVATMSSSKKIDRRREATVTKKRISRRGSIVNVSEKVASPQPIAEVMGSEDVEKELITETTDESHIPDEIKEIFEELAKETGGEGVSLAAIVSWSVMQDAIQCAFMSEVIMWTEFMTFISERTKITSARSSMSGGELLPLDAFFQYCVRLQHIIDTNIEMMESIDP